MSAVTFSMDFEREDTDQAPKVNITYRGTFLPYTWS